MKSVASFAACLGCLLGLLGCATPYQRANLLGGYTDVALAPDTFRVSFAGNAYTSSRRAYEYALLRAAEVVAMNGFRYFCIVKAKEDSYVSTTVTPGYSQTTGYISNTSGGQAQVNVETMHIPPQVVTSSKPEVTLVVKAFQNKPDDHDVFDAPFLIQSLRAYYGLRP
ncbi:CC0125/CC1285 family lipoprotein [Limisphaera sp. VF-2]|jgi:hypothetical protein|uniref:CC0125/CC1285 family lipoprotein n=1 Tax=Limisphaera sp. VF-2 TaxID=3400418 RepID=UPI00175E481D